jgi:HSP20 family protein
LNQLLDVDMPLTASTGLSAYPPLNTWLSEDGAVVTAEIPGIDCEGIELSVVNDTLTIKGDRQHEPLQEGQVCHRQERGAGSFSRTVQLPFAVEPDHVEASFKKGVLEIRLPRAASEKPKKIAIKSN